ncbi:MAG: hypothetical protein ABIP94_02115 [Planctomycetota bacterium]
MLSEHEQGHILVAGDEQQAMVAGVPAYLFVGCAGAYVLPDVSRTG